MILKVQVGAKLYGRVCSGVGSKYFVLLVLLATLRTSGKGLGPHQCIWIWSLTWWFTDLLLLNISRPTKGQILC